MVALASMVLTPTSVSVVTAGRGPTVKPVSLLLLWGTDGSRVRGGGVGRWNKDATFPWEVFLGCRSSCDFHYMMVTMTSSHVSPCHLLSLLGSNGEEPLLGHDR